jgi:tartrate/fumarate subfamily iron-sulfur-dependent hydro-lyase alpha chain
VVTSRAIAEAVASAIGTAAVELRPDFLDGLRAASAREASERGRRVLDQLIANAEIANRDRVPLCQDTGTVWVRVRLGSEEAIGGDLQAEIDAAVERAYRDHSLRMSVARDALLDRANTGTNAPAFIDVVLRPGSGATVDVMLKGGGSDNASSLVMLDPSEGFAGVKRVVVAAVEAKAPNACPPLLVGVGVGGTFDKVGGLAKAALLRRLDEPNPDPRLVEIEAELLAAVNATGIGPAGLGGATTALAVHVVSAASHIAALPVAVNMGCSAVRTARVELPGADA